MTAKRGGASTRKSGTNPPRRSAPVAPDAGLSLERIVAAAVELLDEQGVGGLSMRRLADRLGCGVMSLYWHAANKEVVLGLALDSVLAYRPPSHAKSKDWRGAIAHMLVDWRAEMLRHPWSASLLPRQALGPNVLARLELLGQTLTRIGVAQRDLNPAIWSLWNYLMGATITRASFDLTDEEREAAQQAFADLNARYPIIAQSQLLMDNDWDGAFRKGIEFLLDGIAPARRSDREHLAPKKRP